MVGEDMYKMTIRSPGFVGLFEWVIMTFGLKNVIVLIKTIMEHISKEQKQRV
jgi:hypothetical protein